MNISELRAEYHNNICTENIQTKSKSGEEYVNFADVSIAALALGTGDLDCVYHFALPELNTIVKASTDEGSKEILAIMVEGRRLRDISDLPFDLAL